MTQAPMNVEEILKGDKDCGDRYRRQQPDLEQVAQAQTRSILARPNKPWGMATSTIRMIRKATASL